PRASARRAARPKRSALRRRRSCPSPPRWGLESFERRILMGQFLPFPIRLVNKAARHRSTSRPAVSGRVRCPLAGALRPGAILRAVRGAVLDRFLERNQALRLAIDDLEHLATLLGYLASVSEARRDPKLPEFCRSWERRLRRRLGAIRRAAFELGSDPDAAVRPLDPSAAGRAAHGLAWAVGSVGEWTDRRLARRKGG